MASVATEAQQVIRSAGYVGLAAVMIVENVFPPIPSELVLPLAGFEVSRGQLTYVGALLAATVGSLIGAWIIYAIGRIGGTPLVLRLQPLLRISADDIDRAEGWFARRGDWIVIGARLIPGARSIVSAPAGMLGMPLWRFSVLTTIGSLAWNAALIAGGQALGSNWKQIGSVVGPISTLVVALATLAAAAAMLSWRRRRSSRHA